MALFWRVAVVFVVASGLAMASTRRFDTHPHIQCSACHAVAQAIGDKMNATAKIRSSFKAGHRLDENNKVKMQDYESSELRAIEIMESVCGELSGYQLRQGSDGVRVVSKNTTLKVPRYYGRKDREELESVTPRLKDYCHGLMDEHDEIVVTSIRTERDVAALVDRICHRAAKVCGTAKVDKSRKAELAKLDDAEAKEKLDSHRRKKEETEAKAAADAEAASTSSRAASASETDNAADDVSPQAATEEAAPTSGDL
jgi:hypothetical protein